jgi:hypothetical protein
MRRANPVAVAMGLAEGPRVTFGPKGQPTKPRPASTKAKNRARNKRARTSRARNR